MDFYFIFSRRARPIAAAIQQHQPYHDHMLEKLDIFLHGLVQARDDNKVSVQLTNTPYLGYNLDAFSHYPDLIILHGVQGPIIDN